LTRVIERLAILPVRTAFGFSCFDPTLSAGSTFDANATPPKARNNAIVETTLA
jgi:hypothetical protein